MIYHANELFQAQYRHATYFVDKLGAINHDYQHDKAQIQTAIEQFRHFWGQIQHSHHWVVAHIEDDEVAQLAVRYVDDGRALLAEHQMLPERIDWLEVALSAARQIKHPESETRCLIDLGEALVHQGEDRLSECIALFEQAEQLADQAGRVALQADALVRRGHIEIATMSRYDEGTAHLEAGLVIFRRLNDRAGIGRALRSLSIYEERQGDLSKAEMYQKEALGIWHELDDADEIVTTLNRLAFIADRGADYEAAHEYAQQALTAARQINSPKALIRSLQTVGLIVSFMGDNARSKGYYEEALTLCRRSGERYYAITCLNNLGWIASFEGHHQAAVDYYAESIEITRAVGVRYMLASVLTMRAAAYLDANVTEPARKHLHEALTVETDTEADDVIAHTILITARWHLIDGQVERAAEVMGMVRARPSVNDPEYQELQTKLTGELETKLPTDRLEQIYTHGAQLTLDDLARFFE